MCGATMEFTQEGWARALQDCDSSEQRANGQDGPVRSRNFCARRGGQAVEPGDDEIKHLLGFDPMVGVDWLGVAPDPQEPEQVDWRGPSLNAALCEIVEQTLSTEGILPRGERGRISSAPDRVPLPHRLQRRSA